MRPALQTDIGCRGLNTQTSVYIYDATPTTMTRFAVCAFGEEYFRRSAIAPNNGTKPGIMNPFVAQQNAQFNQCVKSGAQAITHLAEVNGFLNPDDYTNDSQQAANSRDLQVDCLKQNPLAALSPNYSGMYGPASPAVVGIFSSNWF